MHIVRFVGGLGNQLFQLQLYERLTEEYGSKCVYADASYYDSTVCHSGFELSDRIALNTIATIPRKHVVVDERNFDSIKRDDERVYYYDGYWQSVSYFPNTSSLVERFFSAIQLDGRNRECLDKVRDSDTSVSVHARRGDYVEHFLHGNITNRAYYQNAIDYVCGSHENAVFFVFSDDIEWCRNSLHFGTNEVVYVDWNSDDVCADMLLMSKCRINIISNSSFSWWAQHINKREDKILIAPEYWFNDESNEHHPETDDAVLIPNFHAHDTCLDPFFSIIIPAYNVKHVIRRCLASVLNQTFEDYEVIIVNDGSADDTCKVVEEYSTRDKRIRTVEHDDNRSLLAARISGMQEATGEYIFFVDSDDYIDEKTCETLHNHLSKKRADIVEYSYVTEPGKEMVSASCQNVKPEDVLHGRHCETVWNKCYSRNLVERSLDQMESFYCNMGEDGYFSTIFFANCDCFYGIENALYHYVGISGMSNNNKEIPVEKHIQSLKNRDENLRRYADLYGNLDDIGIGELFARDVRSVGILCAYSRNTFQSKKEYLLKIDEMCNTELFRMYLSSKRGFIDAVKGRKVIVIIQSGILFVLRIIRESFSVLCYNPSSEVKG